MDIQELAENLYNKGYRDLNTGGAVVEALIDLGNTEVVYAFHDDHNSLSLSDDFKDTPLEDLDESKFEFEIDEILEQADIIIPLSEKILNEDDINDIKEDMILRGEED